MNTTRLADADTARLLTSARLLLLDFDGPICAVFGGRSAATVAAKLRAFAVREGVVMPDAVHASDDPLAVLRHVGQHAPAQTIRACDEHLTQLERQAIPTATPTPGAEDVLLASRRAGVPVVIVSNNSTAAIRDYLTLHHLDEHIARVHGRPVARPDLMKPDPSLLVGALALTTPAHAVFVGDSSSDITAANAAGVPVIALANKPGKATRFTDQGASHVVDRMSTLAAWLVSPAID